MSIFEDNRKKYEIKCGQDQFIMGAGLFFSGGVINLFIITAIIGIPMMIIGVIMMLTSPFYSQFPKWKEKYLKWCKELDRKGKEMRMARQKKLL